MTTPTTSVPAVTVEGVSKRFVIPHEQPSTLKERALHPFRRSGADEFQALDDVSFQVEPGEFFGIVGRNGSGKSTLLKCMAGIYRTDAGSIYVNGRVSTFIELGVGFNPDLAARDNVTLNAIMLGLSPGQAKERFERVIEFAELEQFVDLKLRNYSSGMTVRLAFSVMIQVDAQVLLIDEVLAVGDAAFQQKCFDEFYRMRDEGRTLLLVTHDMGAVIRFCHRAMLLEHGKMVMLDKPRAVADRYMELNFPHVPETPASGPAPAVRRELAVITDAWFEDDNGERSSTVAGGKVCTFKSTVEFRSDQRDPNIGVVFQNQEERLMFASSTMWLGRDSGTFKTGDVATLTVRFENPFASGRYYATPFVAERGTMNDFMDKRDKMTSVMVTGSLDTGAYVNLPHDLDVNAGASQAGMEVAR
jgi:ABC-type polysaccharide/polyol phosphate transport system ATPase subunit